MQIRLAHSRGHANHGWLDSFHTFSFAHYFDPEHMGFGPLRVINEDRVEPGTGFDTHGHSNMEIISYVLEGALEHKDSIGNGSIIRAGDVQRMSAGTGIRHSECNPSRTEPVHFLQIWIIPERKGIVPSYEQKNFGDEQKSGKWCLIASHDGRDGSLTIHQEVNLYSTRLAAGQTATHVLAPGRGSWIQVARGSATLNGQRLATGDGVAIDAPGDLAIECIANAELLLFDMAM